MILSGRQYLRYEISGELKTRMPGRYELLRSFPLSSPTSHLVCVNGIYVMNNSQLLRGRVSVIHRNCAFVIPVQLAN